jgi:hypothetical protein
MVSAACLLLFFCCSFFIFTDPADPLAALYNLKLRQVKNRGCPSHFPVNEVRKVAEWVWGEVTVTYHIGNLM